MRKLLVFIFLLTSGLVLADERILSYHSNVIIHADGSLVVTETIRVRAEGENIRRGIYRDFPTAYKDRYGNHYRVTFNVMEVRRDGRSEAFRSQQQANGVRVYIGSSDHMLTQGEYEYRLRYRTTRQLGFYQDYDELYWNVTGNGWMFPIDHASASIELPDAVEADALRTAFYTGVQGSDGQDARVQYINARTVGFQTTRVLLPREGLTVVAAFPKGVVKPPTDRERLGYFLDDNGAALVLLIGLLTNLSWYFWAWNRFGRDPRKGVIIPRFKPPTGLTPAGCSYIRKMAFGKQTFAAAIISLGVKGYLEIHEEDDQFTLRKKQQPDGGQASKGERAVLDELFTEGGEIELIQENYQYFSQAHSVLKKALKAEHLGRLFNLNLRFALPALAISLVTIPVAAQFNGGAPMWIVFIVLTITLHLVFVFLLRAPTPAGRKIMDDIEGFRMYLDTAEQDRLERMQSPQLTPAIFETFLPFAFALGVENSWCTRFSREFPENMATSGGYQPGWYVGSYSGVTALGHSGDNFSSSFASAISSASSPPGSSSGSGGGGFSGGGGGGGGGGGW